MQAKTVAVWCAMEQIKNKATRALLLAHVSICVLLLLDPSKSWASRVQRLLREAPGFRSLKNVTPRFGLIERAMLGFPGKATVTGNRPWPFAVRVGGPMPLWSSPQSPRGARPRGFCRSRRLARGAHKQFNKHTWGSFCPNISGCKRLPHLSSPETVWFLALVAHPRPKGKAIGSAKVQGDE